MDTSWQPDLAARPGPKYRALAEALTADVRDGRLTPGTKLPPVRDLAWALQVTPGTVARAYQLATDAGVIEATVGRGTFVRDPAVATVRGEADWPRIALSAEAGPGTTDFLVSRAVEVGQSRMIGELAAGLLRDGVAFTRYLADPDDLMPCRTAAADWLSARGIAATPGTTVLSDGALNSVLGALLTVLHGRDPVVLTEALTYPGFRRAIRAARARQIAIASDAEGPLPAAVAEACARHPAQAILLSANAHNPTTRRIPPARRAALAEIARAQDLAVIEDDTYGLALPDRAAGFDTLCPERAWVAASLSKCVAAGLRTGFLVCPPGQAATVSRTLHGLGLTHAPFGIALMQRLLTTGAADRIAAMVQAESASRVSLALRHLGGFAPDWRPALNFLWLRLPEPWRVMGFVTAAERQGLRVAGADIFADPDQGAPHAVRVSLAGPPDTASLETGLAALARLLATPPADLVA